MNDSAVPAAPVSDDVPRDVPARSVTLGQIFIAFLVIGGTSFGGGLVGHLRTHLVERRKWIDDSTFLEILAIRVIPDAADLDVRDTARREP